MKFMQLAPIIALAFLTGCEIQNSESRMPAAESLSASAIQYSANTRSLFPADLAIMSDMEITKAFGTKITVPENAKIAVVCDRRLPWAYWSEETARLNQQATDDFAAKLRAAHHVHSVSLVPDMLLPPKLDIPNLRQTAARLQADLLLVYQPASENYSKSKFLRKNETHSYCTVEAALVDTRSGVVIFTTRASEDFSAQEGGHDINVYETLTRAQQQAAGKAMSRIAADVAAFLNEQA